MGEHAHMSVMSGQKCSTTNELDFVKSFTWPLRNGRCPLNKTEPDGRLGFGVNTTLGGGCAKLLPLKTINP